MYLIILSCSDENEGSWFWYKKFSPALAIKSFELLSLIVEQVVNNNAVNINKDLFNGYNLGGL